MNLDELERLHRARSLEDDSCQQFCDAVALAFPALLALARDGERYRWLLTKLCMIQTASYGCKFEFINLPAHFGDCEPDPIPAFNAAIDAMKERT